MRFPALKCGIPYTWVPDRLGQSAIESTSSADGGSNSRVLLRKRCALTTRSAILPARLSSPRWIVQVEKILERFSGPHAKKCRSCRGDKGPDFHKCWPRLGRAESQNPTRVTAGRSE